MLLFPFSFRQVEKNFKPLAESDDSLSPSYDPDVSLSEGDGDGPGSSSGAAGSGGPEPSGAAGSGDPIPLELEPPPDPHPEAIARRARADYVHVRGERRQRCHFVGGFITLSPLTNDMIANCTEHDRCTRSRTLNFNPARVGSGRPVGHLVAWLEAGVHLSAEVHSVFKWLPDFPSRSNGRHTALDDIDVYQELFNAENGPVDEAKPYREPPDVK